MSCKKKKNLIITLATVTIAAAVTILLTRDNGVTQVITEASEGNWWDLIL